MRAKQIQKKSMFSSRTLYALLALTLAFLPLADASSAEAASLSQSFVRFDRMKISTPTTGTVCAKSTTVSTEASVRVTFPASYTVSATTGNWTVNTTNLAWPTGGTAWPGIGTATAVASQVVTFPSTDLTVGTLYCFNWTNSAALTIKATATASNIGSVATYTSGPVLIDSESYATASVSDDQIVISATVPQAFSFTLSANTDALGSLSTAAVSTSPTPRTVTINTNAKSGWTVWGRSANAGLTSPTNAYTLASTTPGTNSTLVSGTEGYNIGLTTSQVGGGGTISVAAPFVGTGAGQGGGLDTTLRTLASSTGTADTAVLTLKNNVAISNLTPAASDYTDTLTVVGAGLF